ncbi:hypothetical protein KJ708_09070 [bacterium]|nr:hypothetical protein [bacterium]
MSLYFKKNYATSSQRIGLFTYVFLFLVCIVNFTQCGGGDSSYQNSGIESSEVDSSGVSLAEIESDLYESGPVKLSVTMAKLQSLDPDLISAQFIESESLLEIDSASGVTAGTKVYAYNIKTEISQIVVVEDDSFTVTIAAAPQEQIALAVMNDDETQVGIPIYVSHDGVTDIVLTNTDGLATDFPIQSVNDYMYFSRMASNDSKYDLTRLALNTRHSDIVVADQENSIRFVSVLGSTEDLGMGLNNGKFYAVDASSTNSTLNQILTEPFLSTTWGTPTLLFNFGEAIPTFKALHAGMKMFYDSDGGMYICQNPWYAGSYDETDPNYIKYIDSNGNKYDVVNSSAFIINDCDQGQEGKLFVLARRMASEISEIPTINTVYELAMTDGKDAFDKATIVWSYDDGPQGTDFEFFDVNGDDDEWIVAAGTRGDGYQMTVTYNTSTSTETIINNSETSENLFSDYVKITPDGVVVQCNDNATYLVAYKEAYYQLTNGLDYNPCLNPFEIDSEGRLLFYREFNLDDDSTTEAKPQIAFINMNHVDYSLLDY